MKTNEVNISKSLGMLHFIILILMVLEVKYGIS